MPRDDSVLPAGQRLSHYRVRRVLGRGGFGVTYLAVDERDGGQVAVKEYFPVECAVRRDGRRVLARAGHDYEDAFRWGLERFRDEGRVLARFSHPNVVRVIGDFEAHGTHCIVMAYVDGETLSARLAREGPLDEARSLAVVLPIVDGLEQVHAAGYLHRDIKPSNIVIGAGGAPVLLDFGAARRALGDRTRSLTAVVSDGYAPLEQYARDSRQGPWTDIYALGAVLYRCLTNRPLPEAPARAGGDELAPATEASPHRLSPELSDALDAALAVRAADRPPTLAAWRQMIGRSRHGAVEPPPAAARGDGRAPDSDGAAAGRAPAGAAALSRQRQRLVDWIRRQLIGPAGSGRLLGSPVDRYPAGVLHPVDPDGWSMTGLDPAQPENDEDGPHLGPAGPRDPRAPEVTESTVAPPEDEEDEEDDSPAGGDETRSDAEARPVGRRRYVPPSSVGLSFFVRGDARLRITASAASYRRVRERGAAGRFVGHAAEAGQAGGDDGETSVGGSRARYERTPFECGLSWPEGGGDAPAGVERQVRRRPYRDGDVLTATFSSNPPAAPPGSERAESPAWETQLDVRRRSYRDGHILTVVFANRQREARPGADRAEQRLFEARVECVVEAGELAEYPRVDPAVLTDEEQEIELRYRDTHIYAIGHGAAADWALELGRPPRIRSACMPAVDVPLVTTRVDGVDDRVLVMHDIAGEETFRECLSRFEAFVDAYGAWVGRQRAAAGRFTAGERAAADRICARMDAARERMRGGVERLRRDADAALAFQLANRAMLDQMRRHDRAAGRDRDVREYRWRPFQLAFLLAVIESTLDEQDAGRDVLDLIWFPTGGGKTEAYLGLIAFLIVWRRLRHGEAGGGTAVLMRYTLRLLTRQQFERAARLVCALERLRRRGAAPLGEEPITVGLWVGAAASPNTFEAAAKQVSDSAAARDGRPAAEPNSGGSGGAETPADEGARTDARAAAGGAGQLLGLQSCPWCARPFVAPYGYRAGPQESGFLCGDPECEFGDGHPLPCHVVDEALYERPPTLLVGTIDKFARLAWEERAAAFFGRGARRPPELVIQDELHLVAGPLGSVAGVYEAALDTVLERRGVRPKYIASTATIRTARDQVRRLYGRDMAVFPPPGLSADDSWFARTDRSRPGRLYVGYLAPGLDRQRCLAPLAAVLLAAPRAVFEDQPEADDLLDAWWTQVVYHGSLRGVGASHNAFVTDVRTFLRRVDAERAQAAREGSARSESGSFTSAGAAETADGARFQPAVAQLTSRSSAQENARTFDRLAVPRGAPGCLDAVLATNMISVGVDVDRLAAMVVNGQPLTTAEYIQASSRIGRGRVPGLVVANYYRQQARSLSHYENFRPYHESFYRFVEPTSVTPFTYQVRKRALHAALVVALRQGCDDLTANGAAGRFRRDGAQVQAVVEALKRRCRRAAGDAADDTVLHLDRLVDEWHDEAARCRRENRGLHYDCRDESADRLLGAFDGARPGRWRTLNSMRNVEDTTLLSVRERGGGRRDRPGAGAVPRGRRDG